MAASASLRSLFDGGGAAAPSLLGSLFENKARAGPENQFASWLPYVAYAPEDKIFVNRDSLGFMLEIMPQSGADERMVEVLISLYATCPTGTGIQFHLFASPHVREPLRRYGTCASRTSTRRTRPGNAAGPRATTTCSARWRGGASSIPARQSRLADPGFPLHHPRLPADDERLRAGRT